MNKELEVMVGRLLISFIALWSCCSALLTEHDEPLSIDELLEKRHYNQNLRPNFGGNPVVVSIEPLISTLGPINEQDMTFETSFYLRMYWHDPRLENNGTSEEITSNIHPGKTIWMPDIYVVNVRKATYLRQFTRTVIRKNGTVFFSQKISAVCTCHMDLRKYPMDTQKCSVQFESYAFNKKNLHLTWYKGFNNHIPDKQQLSLTGYVVTDISKSSRDTLYGGDDFNIFENLFLHYKVERTSIYYAYKGFLPTIFLAIFNLGSYWIPDNAMPARVTLIITTFLANTFILQSVSDQTVKVSYTTAMQLFLLVNVIFLMTSIIQYLVLLNMKKKSAIKSERRKDVETRNDKNSHALLEGKLSGKNQNGFMTSHMAILEKAFFSDMKKEQVHILDRIFRVLMPILYLLFCTIYFVYYTY